MSHARVVAPLLSAMFALLIAAGMLVADAAPASAAYEPKAEQRLRALTNRDRTTRGLPALRACKQLNTVARQQAKRMADRGRLYHNPKLASQVPRYRQAAENVGVAASVDRVQVLFLKSKPHRATVLSKRYTQFGVGVDTRKGRRWVAVVFRQPLKGAPCS